MPKLHRPTEFWLLGAFRWVRTGSVSQGGAFSRQSARTTLVKEAGFKNTSHLSNSLPEPTQMFILSQRQNWKKLHGLAKLG